ncbi:MAG TPA: DUF4251 domain-containing protein [Bacteroidales bacterium]|jgi:hypothetical protein|nr:DUF4251 domain-containing protein [Bacteroidales bacterium]HNR43272.1 DUF4251 domain-containing protein [Bacteroidales bacterium]HPM17860.1 DUF4251 domain-containing protein [Bacteroidales bacterium]HQG76495.1 DUF4251 domain-containing protein [Bacteroidales bacterium]
MKTINKNTGNLFLLTALLLISVTGYSQDFGNEKLSRKEKKQLREAELNANYNLLNDLVTSRSFVVEADFLENKYGEKVPVSSSINFIMVNADEGVLQTGSNFRIGYNGVGGVTAEGTIGDYQVVKNPKNLSYNVKFHIVTNLGSYDIFLTVFSDFRARATISGVTSAKLTYTGRFEDLSRSKVYKGMRTI